MRNPEAVTFGGVGLDRADHLRADLAQLRRDPTARGLLFWRGKPLVQISQSALATVSLNHRACQAASQAPLFLGVDHIGPIFAFDLDRFAPTDIDEQAMGSFFDPSCNRHPDFDADFSFVELRAVMAQLPPKDAELAATAKGILAWHYSHPCCAKCGAPSAIEMGGWQRVCPACQTRHFPRTDPVVIMLITRGNETLLGRSHGWPEAMYSCLAGFMEPGETIETAVRREVFEETSVRVGDVRYLASQPWPFPSSLMIGCHGQAHSKDIKIDENEIDDAIWVTKERLVDAISGADQGLKAARNGSIAHFMMTHWLRDDWKED